MLASKALEQYNQASIPCAVPIYIDPLSYNAHKFTDKFATIKLVERVSRSAMQTVEPVKSSYNNPNYMNQTLVKEY